MKLKKAAKYFFWFRLLFAILLIILFIMFRASPFILFAVFFCLELFLILYFYFKYNYAVGYAIYNGEFAYKATKRDIIFSILIHLFGIILMIIFYFVV